MKVIELAHKYIGLNPSFVIHEMLASWGRSFSMSRESLKQSTIDPVILWCSPARTARGGCRLDDVDPGGGADRCWLIFPVILSLVILMACPLHASELPQASKPLRVSLEPFPPLVNADGSGLAIALLRRVEKTSSLRFNIEIMPYSRARHLLRLGQTDIMGPVPLGLEDAAFYRDALELTWHVPTMTDLFVLDPELLAPDRLSDLELGTTLGNSEFLSELSGVPREHFAETNLENLVQMLLAGRIQGIIFERASTLSTFYRMGVDNVYFRALKLVGAGFAVRADEHGEILKSMLDPLLAQSANHGLFSTYKLFQRLPGKGVLSSDGEIYSLEDDAGSMSIPSEP